MSIQNPYTCVIVDDDLDSIDILSDYISKISGLTLIKSYTNPVEALQSIMELKDIDIVFTDVNMPDISGIELSKAIRSVSKKNIVITAHAQYALDAFDIEADGFLLKPIAFSKFALTVNRIIAELGYQSSEKNLGNGEFYVKTTNERNALVKIDPEKIVAIESLQNYIRIYTPQTKVITYITLKEIKEHLKVSDHLMQVHRSYIVSKKYIEKLEGNMLRLSTNLSIPIGSAYKDIVFDYFQANTLKTGRINRPEK